MMKHSERREKVKHFASNNKLFLIIAVCLSIYLVFFLIKKSDINTTPTTSTTIETKNNVDEQEENDKIEWRFYWSDFIVLVGGVGFCGYKIIQRNRKAKEDM